MTFLSILSRFRTLLIFILLEILALIIMTQRSVFQRSSFVQWSMEASSAIFAGTNSVYAYFSLKSTNDELSAYNAELQHRVDYLENLVAMDTLQSDSDYYSNEITFIPAKIINKSLGNIDNYFTLNKGAKDGVKEGFGVVTNGKVLGVVQYVTERYSAVLLVASTKIKLSGKIKKDSYLCTVVWDNISMNKANVYDIPHHVEVLEGDTIVTSGFSSIFPEDYIIGTVDKIKNNTASASNDLTINYATDFVKVGYVDIVAFKDIEEINKINNLLNQ